VYQKGLRLSSSARQTESVGKIVNYMSTDIPEICDAVIEVHSAQSSLQTHEFIPRLFFSILCEVDAEFENLENLSSASHS
jgi:hypothetical protein